MIKMSKRIKKIIRKKGFSQTELGKRIGVSLQVITNKELNEKITDDFWKR